MNVGAGVVGTTVGKNVGDGVGMCVGLSVGRWVGGKEIVGPGLGTGVGCAVGSSTQVEQKHWLLAPPELYEESEYVSIDVIQHAEGEGGSGEEGKAWVEGGENSKEGW